MTSPIPGSVSSSAFVALLTLTRPVAPEVPVPVSVVGADSDSLGTNTCVPSTSGAARLRLDRTAPGRAPPAASIASMTRAPSANSYTPGRRTHPATSTRITVAGDAEAVGAATRASDGPDRTSTGAGSERRYQNPAPATVTPTTATSAMSSARDSVARRSRIDSPGKAPPHFDEPAHAALAVADVRGTTRTLARAGRRRRDLGHMDRHPAQPSVTRLTRRGARTITLRISRPS